MECNFCEMSDAELAAYAVGYIRSSMSDACLACVQRRVWLNEYGFAGLQNGNLAVKT